MFGVTKLVSAPRRCHIPPPSSSSPSGPSSRLPLPLSSSEDDNTHFRVFGKKRVTDRQTDRRTHYRSKLYEISEFIS